MLIVDGIPIDPPIELRSIDGELVFVWLEGEELEEYIEKLIEENKEKRKGVRNGIQNDKEIH